MKTGYYQFAPVSGKPEENREKIRKDLSSVKADLVVLPELAVSGYVIKDMKTAGELAESIPGPTTDMLKEISSKTGTFFVTGLLEESEGKYYNSAVLVGPDGPVATYRKVHLFYEEKKYFEPGDGFFIVDFKGVKIALLVCFDHLFPEAARAVALKGAQVVCHPSNLVLKETGQLTTRVRALENRMFWILSNRYGTEYKDGKPHTYTGESQIIDPKGNILHKAPAEGDEIFIADIDPDAALNKNVTRYNNVFEDLRTDLY